MSLFVPYRALGLVAADDVAFVVNRRGTESWVTVPLRDSFVVYDCAKLRVTFYGPRFSRDCVSALATRKNWTFCAVGRDVVCVKRLHATCALAGGHATRVTRMFVFGFYLVSVDDEGVVKVWDIDDDVMAARERAHDARRREGNDAMDVEEASESESASGAEPRDVELPDGFVTTAIAHPDGYVDKLVFGAADGRMLIMNIRVGKVVYEFASYGSAVRVVENSPAEDVVAVGLDDGRVLLVDVRRDKVLFTLSTDLAHTPVTAMAFRGDGQDDVLCVGDARGRVTVWDLEKRKIRTLINDAHEGRISALSFLDGQPVMVSSGGDNTLKEWIFDRDDGDARLLRFRAGHSKPPTNVTFYGEGKKLLAAGNDRTLRIFHAFADQQNAEFSQKSTSKRARKMGVAEEELKLPPVTRIAWGELRERDWANVVTAHENTNKAYTWRLSKTTIGEHVLQCPKEDGQCAVTSVCVSACGNFAFVGVANGAAHRFNLQSGLHRGALERIVDASAAANQRKKKKNGNEGYNFPGGKRSFWALANQAGGNKSETLSIPAHDGEIACIAADAANRYIVTAGADGIIRVWKFATMKLDMEIDVGHAMTCGHLHLESSLFAVGCADKIVRIYDVVTGKRVRTYEPRGDIANVGDVKSVQISVDGRWVLALDSLGALRVYDIPASRLVQHLILGDDKVTAMSFSPALDFLVTTHEKHRGLYLWVNRMLYEGTKKLAYGRKVSVGLPERMALPDENGTLPEGENGQVQEEIDQGVYIHPDDNAEDDEEFTMEELEDYFEKMSAGPRQIAPGMITLARLPQAHIDTLLNLDIVQEKMKPKEEEKAPEQAPFFLPTAAASDDVRRSIFDPIRESEVNASSLALVAGEENSAEAKSRILRQGTALAGANHTPLLALLQKGEKSGGDYTEALEFLKSASPVVVDGEIRSLGPWDHNFMSSDDEANLKRGITFFTSALESGMYYEMVNAHLQVFLKAHSTAIISSDALRRACAPLRLAMHKSWSRLDDLFNEVRCSLAFHTGQHGV